LADHAKRVENQRISTFDDMIVLFRAFTQIYIVTLLCGYLGLKFLQQTTGMVYLVISVLLSLFTLFIFCDMC